MQDAMDSSLYTLQDVPGKGKGLVAARTISRGTRILSETALVTTESMSLSYMLPQVSIYQQVEALSEDQRRAFLSLCNIYPFKTSAEQYLGIFRTNGLPADEYEDKGAIFLEASRLNHACDNNAQNNWNDRIKRHTVHALREIQAGEEITITYISPLRSRDTRQRILQEKFDFKCLCQLCCLPAEKSQASDRRLEEIVRLEMVIHRLSPIVCPLEILGCFDAQVRLFREQGREDLCYVETLVDAAHLVIANGDLARGRIFAKRAAAASKTIIGSDSRQAIELEALAQDPTKDNVYGGLMKWKTRVGQEPQGLDPNDFEDWIWRRENSKVSAQVANPNPHSARFPAFADLPDDRVDSRDSRQHWCFFGEILDFFVFNRLQLVLKDVDAKRFPLFFYTDGRGSEITPAQCQKGYTVAVLYAKHHVFMFSDPGIRHEDPQMIKIFPLSLDKLLALNDRVRKFSADQHNGLRMCHGCGKTAASLKRCDKCSSFWYCNKACQTTGWNDKGHKADCKFLKDPDLRGLFLIKWDELDVPVRFPLDVTVMPQG